MSDLDQERADLNALVREAHEAIKDLNASIKAADKATAKMQEAYEAVVQRIKEAVDIEVQGLIELSVTTHMDAFHTAMEEHTEKAVARVYRNFETLEQRLIGDLDEESIKEAIRLKGLLESQRRL